MSSPASRSRVSARRATSLTSSAAPFSAVIPSVVEGQLATTSLRRSLDYARDDGEGLTLTEVGEDEA